MSSGVISVKRWPSLTMLQSLHMCVLIGGVIGQLQVLFLMTELVIRIPSLPSQCWPYTIKPQTTSFTFVLWPLD